MAHRFIPPNEIPPTTNAYFYYIMSGTNGTVVVPKDTVKAAKATYTKSNAHTKGWVAVTDYERKYGIDLWL